MCFGPVASFTASTFLSGIGIAVSKQVRARKEWLFAAFPFLFAVQQFIEGVIWLLLRGSGSESLILILSRVYLVFAYNLWPVLCPISVYVIEPDAKRKTFFAGLTAVGVLTSAYLFYCTAVNPLETIALGCSIRYDTFIPKAFWFLTLYGAATILPFFVSTRRSVLMFGLPNLVLCVISFFIYNKTFISVWCFFAALISANLLLFLRHLHQSPVPHEPLKVAA